METQSKQKTQKERSRDYHRRRLWKKQAEDPDFEDKRQKFMDEYIERKGGESFKQELRDRSKYRYENNIDNCRLKTKAHYYMAKLYNSADKYESRDEWLKENTKRCRNKELIEYVYEHIDEFVERRAERDLIIFNKKVKCVK